ncbi:hypothetical protein C8P69_10267 [Phreatobacter oligotrophus]|jgi:hypothetical protein|uniref:Uncharacterized protein n=1 Tax=Phreatobacter oligotrophus TaxID=1122261 RepID=A0A2T4ZFI6_9HYPH|nr:hypothetical protein C8P69_10267 [Phreatobacter oligotrophus]
MGSVLRFPLERRRMLGSEQELSSAAGQVVVLPVVRIERHDLPPPPVLIVDPPLKGGDRPKRRRRSA